MGIGRFASWAEPVQLCAEKSFLLGPKEKEDTCIKSNISLRK